MAKSLIAYVDGFNLYNGLHEAYGHRLLWLDLVKLFQNLRPNHEVLQVSYFTAQLLDEPEAQSRQATYWNALKTLHGDRVSIIEGRYKKTTRTCKACAGTWTHYEEKETDVNLALAIARDAAARDATDYYLVSGDSDAAPAIREAQSLNPTGFYKAYFPPKRHSDELTSLMALSEVIGRTKLRDSQLPAVVLGNEGQRYEQPAKWKPETFIDYGDGLPTVPARPLSVTPLDVRKRHNHQHV